MRRSLGVRRHPRPAGRRCGRSSASASWSRSASASSRPALPLFARQFGVGRAEAGAVVSAFAFMRLVTAPFVGRLVDLLGERVLLATGIGVVAVSSALAGFAQSYWQLLVLRGAGGVGSIMFSVSAASLLVRVTPSHQRGQAQGVWAGSFLIGLIAGPAVGTIAGFSLRAPFFLYAGTLAVAGVHRPGRAAAQRARRAAVGRAPRRCRCATALRNRAYLAALAAGVRRRLRPRRRAVGDRAAVRARRPAAVARAGPTRRSWSSASSAALLLLPSGRVADHRRPPPGDRRRPARRGRRLPAAARPARRGRAARRQRAARRRGGVGLGGARRGHGRRRRRPRRHGRRGVPDGRRPRRGARPGRRRLHRRQRRATARPSSSTPRCACCPIAAVLAAPETLVRASDPAVVASARTGDAASDAT